MDKDILPTIHKLTDYESVQKTNKLVIYRDSLKDETELKAYIEELCSEYPDHYVTYSYIFGRFWFHMYSRKPQRLTPDTEITYRSHGGWFRNGEIVKPSKTWVKRFDYCPVMR